MCIISLKTNYKWLAVHLLSGRHSAAAAAAAAGCERRARRLMLAPVLPIGVGVPREKTLDRLAAVQHR